MRRKDASVTRDILASIIKLYEKWKIPGEARTRYKELEENGGKHTCYPGKYYIGHRWARKSGF
jgi:hypothetical protein